MHLACPHPHRFIDVLLVRVCRSGRFWTRMNTARRLPAKRNLYVKWFQCDKGTHSL
jgi:hypothetical protein